MFERELEALEAGQAQLRARRTNQMLSWLKLRIYKRRVQAYEACFLGQDGELTEDAKVVIAHLCSVARMGRADARLSDAELREAAGARKLVLTLMEFLRGDPRTLGRLVRQAREQAKT